MTKGNPKKPKKASGLDENPGEEIRLSGRDISNQNLKSWPKGTSGNPNGRPKKITSRLISLGYSKGEIDDTINNILAMNEHQLNLLLADPDLTTLETIIVKAVQRSIKYGSLYNLDTLLNRVYGLPKQEATLEVQVQPPLFPDVQPPGTEDHGDAKTV